MSHWASPWPMRPSRTPAAAIPATVLDAAARAVSRAARLNALPANPKATGFAWMTLHKYTPDRPVTYPFKDWSSLTK